MNRNSTSHGILGVATSAASVTISVAQSAEQWLRITSLVVGIVVGVMTGISVGITAYLKLKDLIKRFKEWRKEKL